MFLINIFAVRAFVGVSNLTIYTEYVFGNFLHSCILKLIFFHIINNLSWFY